ncbi:MAG: MGMT family protein [Candidatus Mcinerneyibacterium aminivorans]|uniref:MGMT family protein n=1 Tax=Candidatus Mcinerneyibacterium aminivorans TaxID=2703815 RepID=A0A5D0MHS6_9BACT|nr:MAG: MGMT family protein [Candidatus Mcinerneyibacterium aminivorans]
MNEFSECVIKIINSIPEGKVMTYGQIAAMAGNPRAARAVSWILHSGSKKHNLPWHRVINSKGGISIKSRKGYKEQKQRLKEEGISFNKNDKINLEKYQYYGLKK